MDNNWVDKKNTQWSTRAYGIGCALLTAMMLMTSLPAWAGPRAHKPFEADTPWLLHNAVNLFKNVTVTATGSVKDSKTELVIDGRHEHWRYAWTGRDAAPQLTVDMGKEKPINTVRLWTPWNNDACFAYKIEGSVDGSTWHMLADERKNTLPSSDLGRTFYFPTRPLRYIRTTFTGPQESDEILGRIVEIAGYRLKEPMIQKLLAWTDTPVGLLGAIGSIDRRYNRDFVPAVNFDAKFKRTAWRGERISAQLVLYTATGARQVRLSHTPPTNKKGQTLPAESVKTQFVRYVLGDGKLYADVLDTASVLNIQPQTTRPVWVSIDIPADAEPGPYTTKVTVQAEGMKPLNFTLNVEVQAMVLPKPVDWSFHLDLWQNPWAWAGYHNVEPFSAEHYLLMEPSMRMLANAGQKCISASIIHSPWGGQTYDTFGSTIEWIRDRDGNWRYDYTNFDAWVTFCDACGISKQINCYSMVPWTNRFRYLDEASGEYRYVEAEPGTEAYEAHWKPFLKSFVAHLRHQGWLERTAIAMDERSVEQMQKMLAFMKQVAPELKIALAGRYHEETKLNIHDLCLFINPQGDKAMIAERVKRDLPTTFYVCCGPPRPNTFPHSPPAESAWMGWHAASRGYTGFLRWAYNSWVADPLYDTSHTTWAAGDCFMVYPGARSSIRFERLREGIQAYEKIRIIREKLEQTDTKQNKQMLTKLDEMLETFGYKTTDTKPCAPLVNNGQKVLNEISRKIGSQSDN